MNPAYGPLVVPAVVVIGFLVHLGVTRSRHRNTEQVLTLALLWGLGGLMGALELVTALSHIVTPAATAAQIGFPPGNPFQWEVGMANLSFAVVGFACLRWRSSDFWLAATIGYLVYFWGCAVGHFQQHLEFGNDAPYNWGPLVPVVVIVPLVLLVLVVALRRVQRRRGVDEEDRTAVPA